MWCVIGIPYFIISYYIFHSLYSAAHTLLQYLWLILSGVVRHTWVLNVHAHSWKSAICAVVRHTWVLNVHSHSWKSASKRFRGSWLKRNTIDWVVSIFLLSQTHVRGSYRHVSVAPTDSARSVCLLDHHVPPKRGDSETPRPQSSNRLLQRRVLQVPKGGGAWLSRRPARGVGMELRRKGVGRAVA